MTRYRLKNGTLHTTGWAKTPCPRENEFALPWAWVRGRFRSMEDLP